MQPAKRLAIEVFHICILRVKYTNQPDLLSNWVLSMHFGANKRILIPILLNFHKRTCIIKIKMHKTRYKMPVYGEKALLLPTNTF